MQTHDEFDQVIDCFWFAGYQHLQIDSSESDRLKKLPHFQIVVHCQIPLANFNETAEGCKTLSPTQAQGSSRKGVEDNIYASPFCHVPESFHERRVSARKYVVLGYVIVVHNEGLLLH